MMIRCNLLSSVKRILHFVVLAGVVMSASQAVAVIDPLPTATDPRVKTLVYAPDEVFRYTGYYHYQTSIEFAPGETLVTISMGDSTAWMMNPLGNRLFLKPVDGDATTNMTLITNKRTYLFEMRAEEVKDITDKNLSFIIRFVYPDDTDGGAVTQVGGIDRVPDLTSEDLTKYNFRYTVTGSEDITPLRIFDDGEFTFFEFRGKNADVPAFFQVDKQGNESLVNFRTRGNYIVIERVSARYTLRHGTSVVCVYNEAMLGGKSGTPRKNDTPWYDFWDSSSGRSSQGSGQSVGMQK